MKTPKSVTDCIYSGNVIKHKKENEDVMLLFGLVLIFYDFCRFTETPKIYFSSVQTTQRISDWSLLTDANQPPPEFNIVHMSQCRSHMVLGVVNLVS